MGVRLVHNTEVINRLFINISKLLIATGGREAECTSQLLSRCWWETCFASRNDHISQSEKCQNWSYRPVVPKLGIRTPPSGLKINLKGLKMIQKDRKSQ